MLYEASIHEFFYYQKSTRYKTERLRQWRLRVFVGLYKHKNGRNQLETQYGKQAQIKSKWTIVEQQLSYGELGQQEGSDRATRRDNCLVLPLFLGLVLLLYSCSYPQFVRQRRRGSRLAVFGVKVVWSFLEVGEKLGHCQPNSHTLPPLRFNNIIVL